MSGKSATPEELLSGLEETRRLGAIARLPVWERFEASKVEAAANVLLDQVEAAFSALESAPGADWATLMDPQERMDLRIGYLLGTVTHLLSVKYSDELQAAYDNVRPRAVELGNRMSQSRPIYEAMVALRDSASTALTTARTRILGESIRGMERSGVHLEGDAKSRYQEIAQRLAELSNRFQTNLVKEEKTNRIRVAQRAQLAGVPEPILALAVRTAVADGVKDASEKDGPWHFVVNGVNYMSILQHAEDGALRESFYRAFRERGTHAELDNRPVLEEILRLRQESARLVGFDNYAELSVDAKMAPSVDAVWGLLADLEQAARPAAEEEYEVLKTFMKEQGAAAAPAPWDIPFWTERLRKQRYDYDSEALRSYFQLPRVLDGLFALMQKLYDVEIREVAAGSVPVWDESVSFYEVLRSGRVIAGFYMDPCARPGEKQGGAWMNKVVGRSRLLAEGEQGSSLPVALFVMNSRPPAAGKPALMSMEEVRTLFHEFGHATQHMFTDIEEGGASGMNLVEWDAVELASQFNEYWMEHKPFLRELTAHVDSGERLDDATIDRVLESRNFMIGSGTLRQLHFGKVDLALHQGFGLPGSNDPQTPFEIEQAIAEKTLVIPVLKDESQLPAFGHLFAGGYAAGYYSYKWAEVLAADAFAAFREAGLDDEVALRRVAAKFRETVLGLGGSLPAAEVYRRFRGRDATADALLIDQGLKTKAA
ncbi:MAG: M3 family metallopeptidase [Pseudomonadales bacterium]